MNIIWVGGTGRCGTSPLWEALGQHPDVATGCSEYHILTDAGGAFHLMEAGRRFTNHQLDPSIERFWEVVEHWEPEIINTAGPLKPRCQKFVDEIHSGKNAIQATRALIFDLFKQSLRVRGKNASGGWFCEKTPNNLLAMRAIFTAFPESKFIHIKRNPRGVIESWSRMDWCPKQGDIEATAKHLEDHYYTPWRKLTGFATDQPNYMEVKLEQLCRNPQGKLEEICRFLGLVPILFDHPFENNMVRKWEQHKDRDLLDRLGEPFDKLMGYGWNNALLLEQEAS